MPVIPSGDRHRAEARSILEQLRYSGDRGATSSEEPSLTHPLSSNQRENET